MAAGLNTGHPVAWPAEGPLIYLTAGEVTTLLDGVGRLSASGSHLAFEIEELSADSTRREARTAQVMREYSAMWKGGLPDAPA